MYYLGIALRAQGKIDSAYDYFYKATWNYAWHSAAYYQLAEIDCQRGDFEIALDHLNRSLLTDSDNLKALNLKAIVLRKLDKIQDSKQLASSITSSDCLNHQALNEMSILNSMESNSTEPSNYLNEFKGL